MEKMTIDEILKALGLKIGDKIIEKGTGELLVLVEKGKIYQNTVFQTFDGESQYSVFYVLLNFDKFQEANQKVRFGDLSFKTASWIRNKDANLVAKLLDSPNLDVSVANTPLFELVKTAELGSFKDIVYEILNREISL